MIECKIISENDRCRCENCGELITYETMDGIIWREDVNYCWNCGAKFTEIEEVKKE